MRLWHGFWEWLLKPPSGWGAFYTRHPAAARAWYLARLVAVLSLLGALCLLLFSFAYILFVRNGVGNQSPGIPLSPDLLYLGVFLLDLFNPLRL